MKRSSRPSITSAEFNNREIAKQLLLLEDHLTDDDKWCADCIKKHILMVEALAEEAVGLDVEGIWVRDNIRMAKKARDWMMRFVDKKDKYVLAQEIRKIRKKMLITSYDPRVA